MMADGSDVVVEKILTVMGNGEITTDILESQ